MIKAAGLLTGRLFCRVYAPLRVCMTKNNYAKILYLFIFHVDFLGQIQYNVINYKIFIAAVHAARTTRILAYDERNQDTWQTRKIAAAPVENSRTAPVSLAIS